MPVRVLLGYLGHHRTRYAGGVVLLFATTLSALAIPWVIKGTIEAVTDAGGLRNASGPAGARTAVATGALLVVGLAALQGASRAASRFCLLGASQRVEARIRDDLFGRLLRLPPAFYQAHRTGDLMSRATNDLQAVSMLIGFGFLSLVNTAIVYAGTLAAMLRIDPWLTLAALLPYPALIVVAKRFNSRVHLESLAVQEQLSRLSARVQESLTGAAVVRSYTMEAREVETFARLNAEYLARVLRQSRTQGAFSPIMGIMGGLGALTVLWFGGRRVMDGQLTLGAFVAFSSYLAYLAWPTIALGWVLAIVRRGLTAMGRIVEVLEAGPRVADAAEPAGPVAIAGEVEVRNLTFRYEDRAGWPEIIDEGLRPPSSLPPTDGQWGAAAKPRLEVEHHAGGDRDESRGANVRGDSLSGPESGRVPALRDVSFRIPAGCRLAVVGPTGAGKTTLAVLLARLWDPPPGTIFIDGREIHTIPLADLRRAIGYVPQEAFLFSRPLAENVALGADPGRLEWAGRVAGLDGDIARLPHGWDTVVGERGLTLSGGQRQRATLARALLRQPRILVLDDAFASVDAHKEAEILERLGQALEGRTAILITHRLRAAQAADRVIVLDEGRVVEQGTHAELLASGGLYARLWRRQQLEAALEAAP